MKRLKAILASLLAGLLLSACGEKTPSGTTPEVWRNALPEDIMAAEAVALADAQRNLARSLYAERLFSGVDIFSAAPKMEESISGAALKGYTEASRDYLPEGVVIVEIKDAASEAGSKGYGALPGDGVETLKRLLVAKTDLERKFAAFLGGLRLSANETLAERCRGSGELCARLAVLLPLCDRRPGLTRIVWRKDEVLISAKMEPGAFANDVAGIMKPFGGPDAETLKSLNPELQKDIALEGASKEGLQASEGSLGDGVSAAGFSPAGLFKDAIARFKMAMGKIDGAKNEVLK